MSEFGQWVYVPHDTGHGVVGHVETSQGLVLAEVRTTSEIAGDHDEAHERGRVMAAAEDMLAALEDIREAFLDWSAARNIDTRDRLNTSLGVQVDAAIAKAKGDADE